MKMAAKGIRIFCFAAAAVLTACAAESGTERAGGEIPEGETVQTAAASEEWSEDENQEITESEAAGTAAQPSYADNEMGLTEDGFHFYTRAGYAFITGIPEGIRKLEIPDEIGGVPVAGLDELRWGDLEEVEEIIIPDSCFWMNEDDILESEWMQKQYDLENGTDAEGNPLGDFLYCGNIMIGYIGQDTQAVVPEGTLGIGAYAFQMTTVWENVTDIVLPDGLLGIGQTSCHAMHQLENINIPESVKVIGKEAFKACNRLEEVTLPAGLSIMDEGAFSGTAWLARLKEETQEEFCVIGPGVLVKYKGTEENVTIPDGIVCVDQGVFKGHEEIKSVVFPSSLYAVGLSSFEDCTGLEEVQLNEGLRMIGDRAFMGCTALKTIELPSTVWVGGFNWHGEETEVTGETLEALSVY